MQEAEKYIDSGRYCTVANYQSAAQELQDILSRGLAPFYRSAYRLLGNTADAEDAVQDALFAAYKHLDQFRGQSQMSTWLTTIVRNCARMQLRKRLRHIHMSLDERMGEEQDYSIAEQLADGRPSPEDECRSSELNARVTRSATHLTPALRRTFQLRDINELSIYETAHILGMPKGTVKAQLARARKKIRESIGRQRRSQVRSLPACATSPSMAGD